MDSSPQPATAPRQTNSVQPQRQQQYVAVHNLQILIQVMATRVHFLISLVGGIGIFGYTVFDPSPLRAAVSGIYACGVLWPMVVLYLKKE